jgi:hypothetical protein
MAEALTGAPASIEAPQVGPVDKTPARRAVDEPLDRKSGLDALTDLLERDDEDDVLTGAPASKSERKPPQQERASDEDDDLLSYEDDQPPSSEEDDDDASGEADDDADEGEDEPLIAGAKLPDDFVVDLGNGRSATLADLKRDFGQVSQKMVEFEQERSAKLEEVEHARREVDTQAQSLMQNAQNIRQQANLVFAYAQTYMPAQPQMPNVPYQADPEAWHEYQADVAAFQQHEQLLMGLKHQLQEADAEAARRVEAEMPKIIATEREKFMKRYPHLRDKKVAEKTMTELFDVFEREYGLPVQEVQGVRDSRVMSVMMDALSYRRLKAKQANKKAQAQLQGKPQMIKASRRQSLGEDYKWGLKAKKERFGKNPTKEAGVELLMDLL